MAASLLGEEIDIHSGGEDNIFPHHECEIAQTCAATGRPLFARYWFHTRHLIVEGEKMSKSKGNFFTVRDLLARGASPAAIRLEIIKTHYRSNANFTFQGLQDSQRMIDRWSRLEAMLREPGRTRPGETAVGPLTTALATFKTSLCDDLNIAGAIGALNEAVGQFKFDEPLPDGIDARAELDALRQMNAVLGVLDLQREGRASTADLDVQLIEAKIAERTAARKARDFKRGDAIRDELLSMGIEIKDSAQGTTWTRIMR
jgi:cysteinyl-tRNA synthetase